MKTRVIAVSGYSGAGKSTVVSQLSKSLNCPALFFDDYASRRDFPNDLNAWLKEGGDPNAVSTPLLQNHLIQLRSGQPIERVKGNGWAKEYGIGHSEKEVMTIMPGPLILIEEPFGGERRELKDLIDFVIYLDLEPEIALARRIHDLIQHLRNDSESLINLLDHFLFDYLYGGIRDMYFETGKKVKANSDLIIDANKNIDGIVLEISEWIVKMQGC
ncbi:uridine kinase [Fontibacillus phaseoli]|uniref:Uridine kinase n=1 Tax=Fontibacillus phaseoli TaxID=1416533 RepID=A0A369BLG3_9BACL|nr:hypothetical protein [Fontibacillus phaseoli]RCX21458.1 uridine kinase [Fontibacillus phaseoli]